MLATVEDLASFMDRDLDNDARPRAEFLLGVASGIVRAHCGQVISQVANDEQTETLSGDRKLYLAQFPVTALGRMVDDAFVAGSMLLDDEVLTEGTDYTWTPAGIIKFTSLRSGELEYAYTHGHDPVPPEVVGVVCSLATGTAVNPTGATSEQIGAYSFSMPSGETGGGSMALSDDQKTALDPHKRWDR